MVTWSDDDTDDESEDVTTNVVKALAVKNNVECDSSDEEMTDKELTETYKLMYTKWKERCVVCEKQKCKNKNGSAGISLGFDDNKDFN